MPLINTGSNIVGTTIQIPEGGRSGDVLYIYGYTRQTGPTSLDPGWHNVFTLGEPIIRKTWADGDTGTFVNMHCTFLDDAVCAVWRGIDSGTKDAGATVPFSGPRAGTGTGALTGMVFDNDIGMWLFTSQTAGVVATPDDTTIFNLYTGPYIRVDWRILGTSSIYPSVTYACTPDTVCSGTAMGIRSLATFLEADIPLLEIEMDVLVEEEPPPPGPEGSTERFAAGNGSQYVLVAQLTDSGNELRSKVIKSVRQTGKRTNVEAMIYGYDIEDPVVVSDLEDGVRANVKMTTRPQALDDSTQVSQSKRKQINIKNAVLSTVRISGDDRGQTERDRIDEVVLEQAVEGARR